jgi:hypothetical protein
MRWSLDDGVLFAAAARLPSFPPALDDAHQLPAGRHGKAADDGVVEVGGDDDVGLEQYKPQEMKCRRKAFARPAGKTECFMKAGESRFGTSQKCPIGIN